MPTISINMILFTYRLFALQDDIGADILQVYNDKTTIDLPQSSHFLSTANASINATDLRKSISQWLAVTPWPAWNVSIRLILLRNFKDAICDLYYF